ncbi:MAG: rhodanese-like domain-containing protein [Bacteroidales bacterium]
MKKIIALSLGLLFAFALQAKTISVSELAKIQSNKNVVIVDTRSASDYAKTHIKGAINLDVNELCLKTPIEGKLKSKSQIASVLGQHGISQNKTIVTYCETGVRAGRMYWILKYMGAKDVRMLDGQMKAWFKARKPITNKKSTLAATTFSASVNSGIYASKSYVSSKMKSGNVVLVDTREASDFTGGHIGNAVNIPHKQFLNGSNLKSSSAMQAMLDAKGVSKNKEIILYCKTSTTAGLAYFVLDAVLNYPNVRIYDGAYLEWKS